MWVDEKLLNVFDGSCGGEVGAHMLRHAFPSRDEWRLRVISDGPRHGGRWSGAKGIAAVAGPHSAGEDLARSCRSPIRIDESGNTLNRLIRASSSAFSAKSYYLTGSRNGVSGSLA